jgi:uncharacterized protein YdgA (DUF945 family)
MSAELFEVVFSGQISEDAELDEVKAGIGEIFKADDAMIERLFSGKRIVIKKNLDKEAAHKYSMAFKKVGAICELNPMFAAPAAATPADMPAAAEAPAARSSAQKPETPNPQVDLSASVGAADRGAPKSQGVGKIVTISGLVAGILALVVAAMPYFTGMLVEQHFKEVMLRVQDFSAQQPASFKVRNDVDYQRGWLTSTVVNTVTLEFSQQEPVTFKLNSNISHGPLLLNNPNNFGLAAIDTKMPLTEDQQAGVARICKDNFDPIQILSHIDFNGDTITEVAVAEFTLDQIEDNSIGKISFGRLLITATVSEKFSRIDANIDWNGLQIDTPGSNIVMGKLTGYSQKHLSVEDLWLGDDELVLSVLTVKMSNAVANPLGKTPSSTTMEEFKVSAHSEVDRSIFVKGHTTITVKNLIVENKSVASDLKLTIAVENLLAKPLQAIARKLSEHQNRAMQSVNPGQAPNFAALQEDIGQILAAGPVLKIPALQANTEQGKVRVGLEATVKTDDPVALQNPMFLLLALQASGSVSVPASLVEATPLALYVPVFIEQGYITSDKGQLKSKIKFQQGQLTLNGKTLRH